MDFDFNDRPFIVIWETTRACALACRHCRAEATLQRHPLELNTAESLRLIDQVARARPVLFVLTGGDPVRRPDLEALITHAAGQGLRVALSPSATPELVATDFRRLRDCGVSRISLSLDGASRETHDRFRGVVGTWDWTMQALAKADAAGLPVQINTTFTRQNLGEFGEFVRRLDEIRPVLWSVFQLVPTGRGSTADLLTAEEMEELFGQLHRLSLVAPYDIKTTEGQHYRRVVAQQRRGARPAQAGGKRPFAHRSSGVPLSPAAASIERTTGLELLGPGVRSNVAAPEDGRPRLNTERPVGRAPLGINDGKGFVFISHTGSIQPSGFLPLVVGQVRRDELIDVYRNSPLFRALREPALLEGKCGRCEFKTICGGSRARAFAMTGNPLGEEPLCVYQPVRAAAAVGSCRIERVSVA